LPSRQAVLVSSFCVGHWCIQTISNFPFLERLTEFPVDSPQDFLCPSHGNFHCFRNVVKSTEMEKWKS
jgi:hypothetical protein